MASDATVVEVLTFEPLPPGATGSRRAVVLWSDGSVSEAMRWFDDEILVSEGDLLGKKASDLTALKFRRDRDWLQS